MLPSSKSVQLLGVRVNNLTWPELMSFCEQALQQAEPQHIVTVNGEQILLAQENEEFMNAITEAELVIPDSTNVIWVSRLKGQPLKQRTPGTDFAIRLAELAAKNGKSLYLLGSKEGVAQAAAEQLTNAFPSLIIAGTSSAHPDDTDVPATIKASGAAIVLVAYGAPAQNIWIEQHKAETGAQILVGVGGALDMISGSLPRAPKLFRILYLEWLWRLILQPRRAGRIWNAIVVFPLRALFSN